MFISACVPVMKELVDAMTVGDSLIFAKRTMSDEEKDHRWGPVVARFRSSSSPGKYYEVRKKGPGQFSCNCKGWCLGGGKWAGMDIYDRHCKHTDAAKHGQSGDI